MKENPIYTITDNVLTFERRARKYGYVMGIRSPVQDYNATPVLKVIGYNTHYGVECNPYIYTMIGGDNDGDALGMVALDEDQLNALAPYIDINDPSKGRKGLDASNPRYYDKGYLEKVNKDLTIEDISSINRVNILTMVGGKSSYDGTRKGEFHRSTWHELFYLVFGEKYGEIIENINLNNISNEEKKIIDDTFGTDPNNLTKRQVNYRKMYVNGIINMETGGENATEEFKLKDYDNNDALNSFYLNHLSDIHRQFIFDLWIEKFLIVKINPSSLVLK